MNTYEIVRLVVEIIALIGFLGGGVRYLASKLWHAITLLEKVDDKQATMNGTVADHLKADEARFGVIAVQLGRIEGRLGLEPLPKDRE